MKKERNIGTLYEKFEHSCPKLVLIHATSMTQCWNILKLSLTSNTKKDKEKMHCFSTSLTSQ